MLNIQKEMDGTTMRVALEGRIDTASSEDFNREVRDALDGVDELVIDMTGLKYLTSAALRSLLTTHKSMMKKGGMRLYGVNPQIMEIFEFTGFDSLFNIE